MDGVVFIRPPQDPTARENVVRSDETYCWRRPSERDLPECHGHDKHKKQAPKNRIVPLWGGVGPGGFAIVCFHDDRKTNAEDWSRVVEQGGLTKALLAVNPKRNRGPWKAQTVAKNIYFSLRKTARAVKQNGGKASSKG